MLSPCWSEDCKMFGFPQLQLQLQFQLQLQLQLVLVDSISW